MNTPRFRPLKFGVTRVNLRDGAPGTHYLRAEQDLQPFPERLTDRLQHWAQDPARADLHGPPRQECRRQLRRLAPRELPARPGTRPAASPKA